MSLYSRKSEDQVASLLAVAGKEQLTSIKSKLLQHICAHTINFFLSPFSVQGVCPRSWRATALKSPPPDSSTTCHACWPAAAPSPAHLLHSPHHCCPSQPCAVAVRVPASASAAAAVPLHAHAAGAAAGTAGLLAASQRGPVCVYVCVCMCACVCVRARIHPKSEHDDDDAFEPKTSTSQTVHKEAHLVSWSGQKRADMYLKLSFSYMTASFRCACSRQGHSQMWHDQVTKGRHAASSLNQSRAEQD
eukprot:1147595-Pelagomonas_calceolata.AAC.1